MTRKRIRKGGLMDAARRRTIARELCAIAPDPPLFLTNMLDIPSGQHLGLSTSAPQDPREDTPK